MTVEPPVRVIVVNWNSGRDLHDLLVDLRSQDTVGLDTWIIDNASTDYSLALAAPLVAEDRVLRMGRNMGYAAGNNRGFAIEPAADFVLIINPDVRIPDRGAIGQLVELLKVYPELGAIAPTIMTPAGLIEYQGGLIDLDRVVAIHTETHRAAWLADTPDVITMPWIDGAILLIRRRTLDAIGGFDERFFLIQEEVDWCIRAVLAGWQVAVARDVHVTHERSASFGRSTKAAYYYWRNLYLLCQKHAPGSIEWRLRWLRRIASYLLRPRNIRNRTSHRVLAGAWDGLRGRYGPCAEDQQSGTEGSG